MVESHGSAVPQPNSADPPDAAAVPLIVPPPIPGVGGPLEFGVIVALLTVIGIVTVVLAVTVVNVISSRQWHGADSHYAVIDDCYRAAGAGDTTRCDALPRFYPDQRWAELGQWAGLATLLLGLAIVLLVAFNLTRTEDGRPRSGDAFAAAATGLGIAGAVSLAIGFVILLIALSVFVM